MANPIINNHLRPDNLQFPHKTSSTVKPHRQTIAFEHTGLIQPVAVLHNSIVSSISIVISSYII